MFAERVRRVMERRKLLIASPETTVGTAAKLMAKRKVGAIMVVENHKLVGMFTERDLLVRVVAKSRDVKTTPLGEVMTSRPQSVGPDKSFGYALLLMHENGFRHVPVVEHGRVIGIVSARDALDPKMEEFLVEKERREKILRERA